MPSRDINDCVPELQQAWHYSFAKYKLSHPTEPEPFLTCTYRSPEEQEALYMNDKNGKDDDGDGKIDEADEWRSNARGGQGKHNKKPSEAFDIAFRIPNKGNPYSRPELFKKFADIIKTQGIEWGGDWQGKNNDPPHFQTP